MQHPVVLKKYPQYYFWHCKLFQIELYKKFEVQVLGSFEGEAFLLDRRDQLAMLELVSTLQASFGPIT